VGQNGRKWEKVSTNNRTRVEISGKNEDMGFRNRSNRRKGLARDMMLGMMGK
jgi:hypothetical protein